MTRTYGEHITTAFKAFRICGIGWRDDRPFSENLRNIGGRRFEGDLTFEAFHTLLTQFERTIDALDMAIAAGPPTIREVNRVLQLHRRVRAVRRQLGSRYRNEVKKIKPYYNEVETCRRVKRLINSPHIWTQIRTTHKLPDQLDMFASNDPLTRLWRLIENNSEYSTVDDVIECLLFFNDIYFAGYLRDLHDPEIVAQKRTDAYLRFVDDVDALIDAKAQEHKHR